MSEPGEKSEKYVTIKINKKAYDWLLQIKNMYGFNSFSKAIVAMAEVYDNQLRTKLKEWICREMKGLKFKTSQELINELTKKIWSPMAWQVAMGMMKADETGVYLEC